MYVSVYCTTCNLDVSDTTKHNKNVPSTNVNFGYLRFIYVYVSCVIHGRFIIPVECFSEPPKLL